MSTITVRPITPADAPFVRDQLVRHFVSPEIWSRDVPFMADTLPGFVGEVAGVPCGHITMHHAGNETEVITLVSERENIGLGDALMTRATLASRQRGDRRLFLTTSNDNMRALGFYQRRGLRIVAIHPGAIDRSRQREPEIPTHAANGIPIHDELELELRF